MRLTVQEVVQSAPSLGNIGNLRINSALKFRLGRVIKQVQTVLTDLEESKAELLKREKVEFDEKTNKAIFKTKESEDLITREIKDLLNEQVDINFDTFSEDTFEKLEISSIDISNVLWLFGPDGDKVETPKPEVPVE